MDWFGSEGINLDSRLEVVNEQGVYSITAKEAIPLGCVVATIPKSAVLSPRNASCSLRINLLPRDLPPSVLLSICLLHEVSIGADSRWAAYIQSLPRSTVTVASLWDRDSSARHWVQGTELEIVLRELGIDKEYLSSVYSKTVLPFLLPSSSPPPPPYSLPPAFDLFLWAYSIVSSRAFQVDTYHGLSLVPLADLFNHSDDHDVHFESENSVCPTCGSFDECTHDAGAGASRERKADDYICDLVTNSDVAAGHEVFNTYGPLSNARLQRDYGFALEANAFDVCSFSFEEVVSLAPLGVALEDWKAVVQHWHSTNLAVTSESTSLLVADATRLFFDAEARTTVALWLLLALGHLSDLPTDVERRCQTLLQLQAEGSPGGDNEETGERRRSFETDASGVVAGAVVALARHRIQAGHESQRTGAEILELAENEGEASTRAAIEFAAGERLLLECVIDGWS